MALADASLSLVQLCESRPSSLITAAMSFHCLTSFASFVFSPAVLIDIRYEYRLSSQQLRIQISHGCAYQCIRYPSMLPIICLKIYVCNRVYIYIYISYTYYIYTYIHTYIHTYIYIYILCICIYYIYILCICIYYIYIYYICICVYTYTYSTCSTCTV